MRKRKRYEDSKDSANLARQHKYRDQHKRLTDLLPSEQALRELLGDAPIGMERKLSRYIVRCLEEIRRLSARYGNGRYRYPLIRDVDCPYAFLFDVTTGESACYCIGKECPRRYRKSVTHSRCR
jgi:hypothetical protein